MKKYIKVALVVILTIFLFACGNKKQITLPNPDDIVEIKIMKNNSEDVKKIRDKEDISNIISKISENVHITSKESINDQPTNVDEYLIIEFYHKNAEDSKSIAYMYKDKGKTYVEQPYEGIWKLNQKIYENITHKFIN